MLKIDRSFVARITDGEQPLQIVRTIVDLARVLGMNVVAEGIETHEQYALLQQLGCRYGQGFLFARPMPAEDVTKLLRLPGRVLPHPPAAATFPIDRLRGAGRVDMRSAIVRQFAASRLNSKTCSALPGALSD